MKIISAYFSDSDVIPNRYAQGRASIERVYSNIEWFYQLPPNFPWTIPPKSDKRYASGLFRIWYLSQHPDTMWMDWDCVVHREIKLPETDKPVFGEYLGSHDTFLIYNGKNTQFFKTLCDIYDSELRGTNWDHEGWIQWVMNGRFKNDIVLLPQVDYKHTSYTVYGDIPDWQSVNF